MTKNSLVRVEAKPIKDNTIYTRTSEQLYRKVYAVSCNTGFSMSEIVRLCLEQGIDGVADNLMRAKKGFNL